MDDIDQFVEESNKYQEKSNKVQYATPDYLKAKKEGESEPNFKGNGRVCQYSEYLGGYAPATATIQSLPSGCYNIRATPETIYAEPVLPPSGLLLELPEMRSEEVIAMAESFWSSEKDYKEGNEFVKGGATFKAGIMLYGPQGCHAKGTEILMYDGSIKKVEDVVVGDFLMGPDSAHREVLELKRGKEGMVKVIPTKGSPFIVNKSHILHLTPSGNNETVQCPINIKVSDIITKTAKPFIERFKLTRSGVNFSRKKLLIPPYILGVWLGDGHSHIPAITSMDPEIVKAWEDYGSTLELNVTVSKQRINSKANCYTLSTQTGFGGPGRNRAKEHLRQLNVLNNKHIPKEYLTSDREDRLQLLAGLIDTDGYAGEVKAYESKRSGFDFISKWEHLANEVVFLCRSLGFAAYVSKCTKGCYVGKEQYFTGEYYRVNISGDLDQVPVLLERKKCGQRLQVKSVLRTGFTFEELPEDDFYGFTLNKDHLYLTADFTIHHNSGKSCSIKLVSKKLVERGGIVFFADVGPSTVQSFLTKFATVEKNRKCVVILEDLDSLIDNYGESHYLDMLDSAQSIDNVLFIATTNYPERLDPRIYNRPGRFSHVIRIGNPSPKARQAYLKAILKNHRDVDYIVEHSEGFSIDHLSALTNAVYREKKELKTEIDRLRRLFKIPKAEDSKQIGF